MICCLVAVFIVVFIVGIGKIDAAVHQISNWSPRAGDHGTLTIDLGDSVQWLWGDPGTHTVQTDDNSLSNFGSGSRSGSSASYTYTFTTAGSFDIYCGFHNNMKVKVVVEDSSPTLSPTTAAPTPTPPTVAAYDPTLAPTFAPSIDLTPYTSNLLKDHIPAVISSGIEGPTDWSATLYVRPHRHKNNVVAFNTRAYCYKDTCSYPGPTIRLFPGDNFTLTLVNELGAETQESHEHNRMHSPNTTNVHTHGLHISPLIDSIFVKVLLHADSMSYRRTCILISDHD